MQVQSSSNQELCTETSLSLSNKNNVNDSEVQVPQMKQMLLDKWITKRSTTVQERWDPESREPAGKKTPHFLGSTEDFLELGRPDLRKRACNHHFPSPDPLVEIAGRIANGLPLPPPWNWTPDEVADWVATELHFPQYKECFTKNRINGRTLLLVEASCLPKMNITNFEHIKVITEGIRKLYNIEAEYFTRSISLPLRFPETCFLLHHLHTGPAYSDMTRLEFFRLVGIVEPPHKILTHWDLVQPYHPDIPGKIVVGRPGLETLCYRCINERRY